MLPIFRLLVAALALLTLATFYYQLSDMPHLRTLLPHSDAEQIQASETLNAFKQSTEAENTGVLQDSIVPHSTITKSVSEQKPSDTIRPIAITSLAGPSPTAPTGDNLGASESEITATEELERGKRKAVVMGALSSEDVAWATKKLNDWDPYIYIVDNTSAPLHTQRNKGREGNAYLSFIIQNYDSLPGTVAFVHSHEFGWPKAWHTDALHYSNVESLNSLKTDFVQKNGYANLRCLPNPGCPDEVQPFREPKDEGRTTEIVFADAWRAIFGNEDIPEVVGVACCAQFAVSGEQIRKRSRDEYVRMHQWLMDTELDDDISGRVFEYLWHIIFGQASVYCPDIGKCYQDVYGR